MAELKTIGDLKKHLEQFNDDDKIVVAVNSYYRAHPVAYLPIYPNFSVENEKRLGVMLPENFRISNMKR